jgi:hypothetical protein
MRMIILDAPVIQCDSCCWGLGLQAEHWAADKNPPLNRHHALCAAQAGRRWCLSGTPIQNSVDELYAYFRFLQYQPYARAPAFKAMLKEPLASQPELGARRLRAALQVCALPLTFRMHSAARACTLLHAHACCRLRMHAATCACMLPACTCNLLHANARRCCPSIGSCLHAKRS